MPNTFTLFFHGTDFHRDKDPNEVVTLLHNAAQGPEARIGEGAKTKDNPSGFRLEEKSPRFLVLEGVGSDTVSGDKSSSGRGHSHPGELNPIFGTKKTHLHTPLVGKQLVMPAPTLTMPMPNPRLEVTQSVSPFHESVLGITPKNSQTFGRALGTGWEDNVFAAVWMLSHLKFERNMNIDTVNMVGWSRGAVTAIMAANKLYEVFDTELKVNLFAIDPVPGGYTIETDAMRFIPPSVRHMLVVLALDDDRANFQPLDSYALKIRVPSGKATTAPHIHFLPLPGNHSDVVFPTKGNAPNSGKLCLHLAHKFLSSHGTRFTKVPRGATLSVDEIVAAYGDLNTNLSTIASAAAAKWNDIVGGFTRQERSVRQQRREYGLDTHRFINEHHRLCALSPGLVANGDRPALQGGADHWTWQAHLPQCGISYA